MHHSVVAIGAFALFMLIGTSQVSTQEEAVSQDKIPKVVMDALLARFPRAKIDQCTRAREGDDIVYDIEFRQEGRKCEADIKANGAYINFEQAVESKDLPKSVSSAIRKRYPKSTLKEIMEEREVKGTEERLSAYEVVLETSNKGEVEVRVSPQGRILEDTGAKKPDEKN